LALQGPWRRWSAADAVVSPRADNVNL